MEKMHCGELSEKFVLYVTTFPRRCKLPPVPETEQ